jgi:hypothetical protein
MARSKKANVFEDVARTGYTVLKHLSDAFNGKYTGEGRGKFKKWQKGGGGGGLRTRESMGQQKVIDMISPRPVSRRVRNTNFIGSTTKKGGR